MTVGQKNTRSSSHNNGLTAWLFLAPSISLLLIFTFYPIICGTVLAFCDFSLLRYTPEGALQPPRWCGVDNFSRLSHDRYFWLALRHSCMYLLIVPVLQLSSILVAFLLSRQGALSSFWRTALYLPVVTSAVCAGIIWRWVLRSDGAMNVLLQSGGCSAVPWLTDPDWAMLSVMLVTFWQGLGYYMILYLAGLQAILPEYAEAASLDGASAVQIFFRITLPLLKPSIALCTMLSCVSALKVFTEIYVITGGGPRNGTLTLAYYVYQRAFESFDMGYAAAMALCLAAVVGLVSLINYALFREGGIRYY
ncbi:sugar ABC transporter permease [bacterium]|nr:sugar ABC transporter permease [bacterium]